MTDSACFTRVIVVRVRVYPLYVLPPPHLTKILPIQLAALSSTSGSRVAPLAVKDVAEVTSIPEL